MRKRDRVLVAYRRESKSGYSQNVGVLQLWRKPARQSQNRMSRKATKLFEPNRQILPTNRKTYHHTIRSVRRRQSPSLNRTRSQHPLKHKRQVPIEQPRNIIVHSQQGTASSTSISWCPHLLLQLFKWLNHLSLEFN